jgi:metal-responsive CopG/Arc/MetJ family transcriptional regulator
MSTITSSTSEVVAVRIPPDLLGSLDRAAQRLGVRRSLFIRSVLLQGMIAHWSAIAPTSQPRGEDAR